MKSDTRVHEKLSGHFSGINSVEIGAEILLQLAQFRKPTTLKELSGLCKLSPSKVHKYLSSLTKSGLTIHHEKSGYYSLGNNAIVIGLAAMHQIDQIDEVSEALPALVKELGHHVSLCVWSAAGPTIIRRERAEEVISVPYAIGQSLPILYSATGRIFAAFLDPKFTAKMISTEREAHGVTDEIYIQQQHKQLQGIRQEGYAVSKGEVDTDLTAIAVPVLDWENNPVMTITVLIPKRAEDSLIESTVRKLMAFAEEKSIHKPTFKFE